MSKYSLCILDDKIPVAQLKDIVVDDSSIIDQNILYHCLTLGDNEWGDTNLRNFVNTIKTDPDFIISGFTNHNFFFNYKQNILFNPDIIVFDWDVGNNGVESSERLHELLSSIYCLVAIFTATDKDHEVTIELSKPQFKEFENRFFIIHKEDADSVEKLKSKVVESKNHFSFEFGSVFRKASMNALDEILVELGITTSNDLAKCLNLEEDENDFRDYISEKYSGLLNISKVKVPKKNYNSKWMDDVSHIVRKKFQRQLSTLDLSLKNKNIPTTVNDKILERLWSYRLYHKFHDSDLNVRKGDIIRKEDDYFFVVNSDCDLNRFWKKNFGLINVIPLLLVENTNEKLKGYLSLTKDGSNRDYKQHSFSETLGEFPQGSFCMPFVPIDKEYKTFIFFAKELTNINIKKPEVTQSVLKDKNLTYDNFIGFIRICNLSEPFLTPVIFKILESISGNGTPNYSNAAKTLINNKIQSIFI